jgi:hypothetical protein
LNGVDSFAMCAGISPDALVCHAVEIYLEYLTAFHGTIAEGATFFDASNIEHLETRKWDPSPEAQSLFRSLYQEALKAPFQEGLSRLKALRDLIGANPGFNTECETISELLGSAWSLSLAPCAQAEKRSAA